VRDWGGGGGDRALQNWINSVLRGGVNQFIQAKNQRPNYLETTGSFCLSYSEETLRHAEETSLLNKNNQTKHRLYTQRELQPEETAR